MLVVVVVVMVQGGGRGWGDGGVGGGDIMRQSALCLIKKKFTPISLKMTCNLS